MKHLRGPIRALIAIGISLALIAALLRLAEPSAVGAAIAAADASGLALAFIATVLAWWAMAVKWHTLVRDHLPMTTALSLSFRSLFYGFVLPGQIAGDIYRSIVFMRRGIAALGLASVVTDRVLGLLALVIIGLAGAVFSPRLRATASWTWVMVATACVGVSCIVALLALPRFLHAFGHAPLLPSAVREALQPRLQSLADAFATFPAMARVRSFAYSLCFQSLCVAALFFLGQAFNANLALADAGWVFAVASIVLLLPISLGGIGLREGTLVGAFGLIGIASAPSLTIGLALTVLTALGALAGGALEIIRLARNQR